MFNAMDIADYIIQKCIELGRPISNIELQKYLYFIYARHLVENNQPLFDGYLEKWKYGPVMPDVYHEYKSYGSSPIKEISEHEELLFENNEIKFVKNPFDPNNLNDEIIEFIDDSIDSLSTYERFELVEMTHEHSEWKKDEEKIMNGIRNIVYNDSALRDYFLNNEDAQIW